MIPVDQTTFDTDGNCFAACVASIFEIAIDDVPDLNPDRVGNWWEVLHTWCTGFGVAPISLEADDNTMREVWRCWIIVYGQTPRGLRHATVWRFGKLMHDPHPSRAGLTTIEGIEAFVCFDPGTTHTRLST